MEDNTPLMHKKMGELTVGENVKVALGLAVATTAASMAAVVLAGKAATAVEKVQQHRLDRQNKKTEKEE